MYQKMLNVGGGGSGASSADKVSYDNTISGLESDNVQGAIDEVNSNLDSIREFTTEEKVVGKWIDGRPLYQKVLVLTNAAIGTWIFATVCQESATIIESNAIIETYRDGKKLLVGYGTYNGFTQQQTVLKTSGFIDGVTQIGFFIYSGYFTINPTSKHYIIVKYVKD